jgi:hypothetical protein
MTSLNPKNMFFAAIGRKLKDQGVEKIIMIFDVITDKYDIRIHVPDPEIEGAKKSMKIDIEDNQISLLKKLFLNKITKKYDKDFPDNKVKKIIVQINLNVNEFEVYIEDYKDIVTKFNY